jgi:hypothetical protein
MTGSKKSKGDAKQTPKKAAKKSGDTVATAEMSVADAAAFMASNNSVSSASDYRPFSFCLDILFCTNQLNSFQSSSEH